MTGRIQVVIILLFTGNVFITSGKFVNATNTPKYCFVVATLLVATAITAIHKKKITFGVLSSKAILWGISIICFLQASYGLFQFVGWLPSNHSKFAITGSFDNPAGFAAVLAMGFPIGLFILVKSKAVERYLATVSSTVITIAVFLSGSPTGIFSIVISAIVFSLFSTNLISKFSQLKHYKFLSVLILICFLSGTVILYYQKKDSTSGRLLIWKVSSEMIKDKPVFGSGYGSFQANYMDYQVAYFKNNPDSKYKQQSSIK